MNKEILQITAQLKNTFEGDPWFGRSIKSLLKDVNESIAFEKPNNQHSILELLWHMITWREFTINRLLNDKEKSLEYFEQNDWQDLDHKDQTLWTKGLKKLHKTQSELIEILQNEQDSRLDETVPDKKYNFRNLLYGIVQHDIYHIGQIAYISKLLKGK